MTAIRKSYNYISYFIEQKWKLFNIPLFFILGLVWWVVSITSFCIIYPFTLLSFNEFTTLYYNDYVVIKGTSFWNYFKELISGRRLVWLDEFILMKEYSAFCWYKEDRYLCQVISFKPMDTEDEYRIFYNGIWNKVDAKDIELCR